MIVSEETCELLNESMIEYWMNGIKEELISKCMQQWINEYCQNELMVIE